jgi:hypothetical protein
MILIRLWHQDPRVATGPISWSTRSIEEAARHLTAHLAAGGELTRAANTTLTMRTVSHEAPNYLTYSGPAEEVAVLNQIAQTSSGIGA